MLPTKKLIAGLIPVGLVSALVAVALAVVPAVALATQVTPAATEITATNEGTTNFYPANGYAEAWVECEESAVKFTTSNGEAPPAGISANTNRTGVGTQSKGPGSVTMAISSQTFTKCHTNAGSGSAEAFVTTAGKWGLAALGQTEASGVLAIAVPEKGATIKIPGFGCEISVSPAQTSAVTATYTNSTHTAVVDGQISSSGCEFTSPAQFEARYKFNHEFEVKP